MITRNPLKAVSLFYPSQAFQQSTEELGFQTNQISKQIKEKKRNKYLK